jgi:hypothetical protein
MTTSQNDNTCRMCNRVHGVDGWNPRHPSVTGDGSSGALPQKDKKVQDPPPAASAWPFDPVLRQALIDKGVLTPQDLVDATAKISAVTSATMGGLRATDAGTTRG